jgi:hypothetical protein
MELTQLQFKRFRKTSPTRRKRRRRKKILKAIHYLLHLHLRLG